MKVIFKHIDEIPEYDKFLHKWCFENTSLFDGEMEREVRLKNSGNYYIYDYRGHRIALRPSWCKPPRLYTLPEDLFTL